MIKEIHRLRNDEVLLLVIVSNYFIALNRLRIFYQLLNNKIILNFDIMNILYYSKIISISTFSHQIRSSFEPNFEIVLYFIQHSDLSTSSNYFLHFNAKSSSAVKFSLLNSLSSILICRLSLLSCQLSFIIVYVFATLLHTFALYPNTLS